MKSSLVLLLTVACYAVGRVNAQSFASIDISTKGGDASANAQAVCPQSLGAATLEDIRVVAENAELTFFNPAIEAAPDAATKAAIQCQKDRNKVLKNTCQLNKALIQNDQAQIDENTTQLQGNTAAALKCADVNTALFISSGGNNDGAADNGGAADDGEAAAPAATTTRRRRNRGRRTTTAAPPAATTAAAAAPAPTAAEAAETTTLPTSFAQIDISRLSGDGVQAEANAATVCPDTLSPDDIESIRRLAEDAESEIFNPAIDAAADEATQDAIQCQKDRNKVLKNHCQLIKAQLENDTAQITENTTQLNKNRGDVTTRCANVDTSLFIST